MMSTFVRGVVPPDEKWKQMSKIYNACIEADIEPPEDVIDFFGGEEPSDDGMEIEIPYRDYTDMGATGVEIDVESIPANVKTVRVYNTW